MGNVTDPPLFANLADGNLRLETNSPCINAGDPGVVPGVADLDGRSRIVGGRVDIGAYEFQSAALSAFNAWLQLYGLPTDGSADFTDSDSDGMNNWQEWLAGTDQTNQLSVLKMVSVSSGAPGLNVIWQSVTNRTYYVLRGANLSQPLSNIANNLPGQLNTTTYTDTTATNSGPYFYRVGVQ